MVRTSSHVVAHTGPWEPAAAPVPGLPPPVGLGGLEPPTSSLSGKRSNRLSYRPRTALHPQLGRTSDYRDYRTTSERPNRPTSPPAKLDGRRGRQRLDPRGPASAGQFEGHDRGVP